MLLKLLTYKFDLKKLNFSFNINPVFDTGNLVTTFFFFALMPYVSPIPLGSDVQILTGFIGYIIIGILFLKDRFIVSPREFLIFILGLFFLVYINPNEPTYQFRKAIGPLYAFGVYYVAKNYKDSINFKILDLVLLIYFAGTVIQYFAPGIFELTFERFIRESKYYASGSRGVTSLAPEPSFLGIVCIYILLIQDWLYARLSLQKNRFYYIRLSLGVLMIILSKSGAGYILLFLFFVSKSTVYIRKYWLLILVIGSIGVAIVTNTNQVSGNKGLSDLIGVLKSTSPKDLLRVSSLSNRVNPVIVGVVGAIEKPLGRGSGAFTSQAAKVYIDNGIDQIYPSYMRGRLLYEVSSDSVSTFGKYIFEYGIFFLIYLILILVGLKFKETGLFTVFLLLTGLLFSLPIVYPPLWLIFGLFEGKIRINQERNSQGFTSIKTPNYYNVK